jgi:hypothetical protein
MSAVGSERAQASGRAVEKAISDAINKINGILKDEKSQEEFMNNACQPYILNEVMSLLEIEIHPSME